MSQATQATVLIEQVQALNRLFLTQLHGCLRAGGPSYGLSAPIARSLAELGTADLERLAALPRALFRIDLTAADSAGGRTPLGEDRLALHLTLLLTTAQASRQHPVLARFFLGLDAENQARLAGLPLGDYLRVADRPGLVTCAFVRRASLWQAWLKARGGYLPPELMLLALQPDVRGGPVRAAAVRSLA